MGGEPPQKTYQGGKMIEVTVKEIEGVRFIDKLRVLEPDTYIGGVGAHRVTRNMADIAGLSVMVMLKTMGLRKVGEDLSYGADLYAQFPAPYVWVKTNLWLGQVHRVVVRWLYYNARFFQQIPPGTIFSWAYFTPYVWLKQIKAKRGKR